MHTEELQDRFGRLVALHRKRLGMTQADLATASGLSVNMIARVEIGGSGVRFPNIAKLATALQIDPVELFAADEPTVPLLSRPIAEVMKRLARLPDAEVMWIEGVIVAALKGRRGG